MSFFSIIEISQQRRRDRRGQDDFVSVERPPNKRPSLISKHVFFATYNHETGLVSQVRLLQKSSSVRLPRRSAPRNDCKDAICRCERSEAISVFRTFAGVSGVRVYGPIAVRLCHKDLSSALSAPLRWNWISKYSRFSEGQYIL